MNPIFDCFEQILDPEEKGGQSDFEHLNEDICEVFVETVIFFLYSFVFNFKTILYSKNY